MNACERVTRKRAIDGLLREYNMGWIRFDRMLTIRFFILLLEYVCSKCPNWFYL